MKKLNAIQAAYFISSTLVFWAGGEATAEPWLSNRYAQNCAACHAPGRLNRPAPDRRCTLSCNGCHVNPQGGGLRNQYGVWNQQRWLRSGRSAFLRDKATPAPLDRQPYYAKMKELASHASEFYGGRRPNSTLQTVPEKPKPKADAKTEKLAKNKKSAKEAKSAKNVKPPEPPKIAETPKDDDVSEKGMKFIKEVAPSEKFYDVKSYDEWRAVVSSKSDFESVVPEDDPYWLERNLSVYAGGDVRYFYINANQAILDSKKTRSWLMGADLGARLRPTVKHNFSFVIEARFLNAPSNQDPEDGFSGSAQAKSAYFLVDDLPYDSTFQMGLYRPLFGHYQVDHDSLSSEISGLNQRALFKGFGISTAPNVPFLVANYIQPYKRGGTEFQTSDGYVVTAGGRFVTYGASFSASYWNTKFNKLSDPNSYRRQMYALSAGGTYGRGVLNLEILRASVASSSGLKNAGNVNTLEGKFRVWRENYIVANYGQANVAPDLSEGACSEMGVGFKSFPVSNVEIEGLYVARKYDDGGVTLDVNTVQMQAHIFF